MRFNLGAGKLAGIVLLACIAAGCANAPPVQEMSDARQAIAAAREAGAAKLATEQLSKAQQLLDSAEAYLKQGNSSAYWQARRAAVSAKEVAFEALLTSRDALDAENVGKTKGAQP